MSGLVRARGRCRRCGGRFQPTLNRSNGDVTDLACPTCDTMPRRCKIDTYGMKGWNGPRYLYSNPLGESFEGFPPTRRQLEAMRREIDETGTIDAARWVPKKKKAYRVDERARAWAEWASAKRGYSTAGGYKSFAEKHLVPSAIGRMDVRDVRRAHMFDLFASWEAQGLTAATVVSYRDRLAAFGSWLFDREELPRPWNVPKLEKPFREGKWISREAQGKILGHVAERHRLLFELLIESGCRPGEIAALRVKDLEDGEIHIEKALDRRSRVKETKGKRNRYIAVPMPLFERLKAHTGNRFGMVFLFVNRFGNPYNTAGLSWIWKRAAEQAGYAIDLYRGTRTSRASQMRRRQEANEREIADTLGNTVEIARRHYARDRAEEVR